MTPPTADDLSPTDRSRSIGFDFTGIDMTSVSSAQDPAFDVGYAAFWAEFGEKNEMESRAVLTRRLAWRLRPPDGDYAMKYEMIVLQRDGEFVAACDQTAIVPRQPTGEAIVHFSHVLIAPPWRGSGLAGWLRAWPIATARNCFAEAALPPRPITIVGECEPADLNDATTLRRLSAFERAGFLKADPTAIHYLQPDFRPAVEIDTAGGPRPVPLSLVVRRVGRENEWTINGRDLRAAVRAVYATYADGFREKDMRPNFESLNGYPPDDATVALVPPMSNSLSRVPLGEG